MKPNKMLTVHLPQIMSIATIITAMTPTSYDNKFLQFISNIFNFTAGNIGRNKNKDAGRGGGGNYL